MKKVMGAFGGNRRRSSVLRTACSGLAGFLSLLVFANVVDAESFTAPFSGNLYLQCVGGSAGATSQFGIGSAPSSFTAYLSNLPSSCPDTEVLVGPVAAGQTIEFGMSTLWLGQTYWAFSFNSDEASTVAFTDVCNSLGMNGKIIQKTGTDTWLMHLNDAAHYTISQCEANNILIQIRLVGTCSLQSFSGSYAYILRGFESDKGSREHESGFSAVGRFVADGNGNFTGTETVSDAGTITRGRQYTGTYTINTDCTGTATFSGCVGQMDFVMSNNNRNVDLIRTDQGTDIAGTAQQQFH